MGLREQAQIDLKAIIEDTDDFGWSITLIDPAGLSKPLVGLSTDVFKEYDQDGNLVSLRASSVALMIESILAAGFSEIPEGIADSDIKPWKVTFDDIEGESFTFKVRESNPDRAVGLVVLHLEKWTS